MKEEEARQQQCQPPLSKAEDWREKVGLKEKEDGVEGPIGQKRYRVKVTESLK